MKTTIREALIADLQRKIDINKDYLARKTKELEKNHKSGKASEHDYVLGCKDLRTIQGNIAQFERDLREVENG